MLMFLPTVFFYFLDGTFGVSIGLVMICRRQLLADVVSPAPLIEWSPKLSSFVCSFADWDAMFCKPPVENVRDGCCVDRIGAAMGQPEYLSMPIR